MLGMHRYVYSDHWVVQMAYILYGPYAYTGHVCIVCIVL